jgi:putative addiction module component (TIGR02574 family)
VSFSDVPPEILNLPVRERLELVAKIWDSIASEGLPPLTQAQRDLIDGRIAEADANPESRIAAEDAFNDLRQPD